MCRGGTRTRSGKPYTEVTRKQYPWHPVCERCQTRSD